MCIDFEMTADYFEVNATGPNTLMWSHNSSSVCDAGAAGNWTVCTMYMCGFVVGDYSVVVTHAERRDWELKQEGNNPLYAMSPRSMQGCYIDDVDFEGLVSAPVHLDAKKGGTEQLQSAESIMQILQIKPRRSSAMRGPRASQKADPMTSVYKTLKDVHIRNQPQEAEGSAMPALDSFRVMMSAPWELEEPEQRGQESVAVVPSADDPWSSENTQAEVNKFIMIDSMDEAQLDSPDDSASAAACANSDTVEERPKLAVCREEEDTAEARSETAASPDVPPLAAFQTSEGDAVDLQRMIDADILQPARTPGSWPAS
eukprot:gene18827-22493_t